MTAPNSIISSSVPTVIFRPDSTTSRSSGASSPLRVLSRFSMKLPALSRSGAASMEMLAVLTLKVLRRPESWAFSVVSGRTTNAK